MYLVEEVKIGKGNELKGLREGDNKRERRDRDETHVVREGKDRRGG